MRARLALLAVVALAAGCVQAPDPDVAPSGAQAAATDLVGERLPAPDVDFSTVIEGDHGVPGAHAVRALHSGSQLLEVVGHNDLTDKMVPGSAGTGWGAIGVWENYVCVAQLAGTGSIAIVDIADPANPVVTAQTEDGYVNGDCEFTYDGRFLFAGAYLGAAPSNALLQSLPIPGMGDLASTGITIWNVEDKAAPKLVLYSDTGTYHTHFLHSNANGTYLVQAYSGNIYKFDETGGTLDLVATITPMDHDMWVSKHPITGKTLLYSGAGQGMVVYDYDDPENPTLLGEWQPPEGSRLEAWHRQASLDQTIEGRAYIVAGGETCSAGNTEPYTVLDVTDLGNITNVSEWEVPGMPVSPDTNPNLCTFSPHEFALFEGYVVTGNYHAGVWLFDIGSPERLRAPVTLGYYIPDREPATAGHPQNLQFPWQPFVWGAFFDERGYVLTADASSGLYVLKIPGVTRE